MLNFRVLVNTFFLVATLAKADTISMLATGDTAAIGNPISISLQISGITTGTAPALGGFDVDILYSPLILQFVSATFIDPGSSVNQLDFPETGGLGFLGQAVDNGSAIDAFGVSGNSAAVLNSNQLGQFVFLTLSFKTLAVQPTTVSLNLLDPNLLFSDANGISLIPNYGNISATLSPTTSAVPEPATWILLAVVVPALWLRSRSQRGES